MSEDDEILKPADLSVPKPKASVEKKRWRGTGVLGLLLCIWALGVYRYFSPEFQEPSVVEVLSTPQPPDAGDIPAVRPTETKPTAVPTPLVAEKEVLLRVETNPAGATIARDGTFEGVSPLTLSRPQEGQSLRIRMTGYETVTYMIPEESFGEILQIRLKPVLGKIRLDIRPLSSRIQIDGKAVDLPADGVLELPMKSHQLEVSAEGYHTKTLPVIPATAYERTVSVKLEPLAKSTEVSPVNPPEISKEVVKQNSQGINMVLPEVPLNTILGSARGTSGRQSNEVEVQVRLKRGFRISETEISNAQFRKFKPEHQSGRWKGIDLNADSLPVVNIGWEEAVAYCNWLSIQEGLAPAYIQQAGGWVLSEDPGDGYRLPTEAEWETIARLEVQRSLFGWGEKMPPPQGMVNVAGGESKRHFGVVVDGYQDLFSGPSAVDKAGEGPLEIKGLFGNVKEWVHDGYSIPSFSTKVFTDPATTPAKKFHVIKGASWQDAGIVDLRIARRRYGREPAMDLGFRVARYIGSGT